MPTCEMCDGQPRFRNNDQRSRRVDEPRRNNVKIRYSAGETSWITQFAAGRQPEYDAESELHCVQGIKQHASPPEQECRIAQPPCACSIAHPIPTEDRDPASSDCDS